MGDASGGSGSEEEEAAVLAVVVVAVLVVVAVELKRLAAAAFFAAAADADSKAACRRARGIEGDTLDSSFAPLAVDDEASADGGGLEGVPAAEVEVLDAFNGVVVTEVLLVATGPMASLSSPNSFHSSTSARSWRYC